MSILDQFGNPIKKQDLLTERALPTTTGVRSILGGYQTVGLNPERLGRIMREADQGNPKAYLEMAEEIEEKDTHYISVIGTRKRAVSQLDITVESASDEAADVANAKIIDDWLRRDQLEAELFHILDAIGKGFSVTEIIWDISEDQWLPKDLKWRRPEWFEFDREDGETLYLRTEEGPQALVPYKFIVHTAQSKSGLAIRGGVVRPCAWMWLFKNFSIKDWVIFLEAYGQPIRIGSYGAGASDKDKDVLMRAVANIGSDAAAIIPESMKIEFIEAGGKTATSDGFERLCKFADQQISKAVLGQTTTTDAISGGHAVSKEHNDVRGDIERSDAKQLSATLNAQLVKPIIDLNRGIQKRYPRLHIGRGEEVDIDKVSLAAERGVKMGMQISSSKLREKLGLPAPDSKDDILTAPLNSQASAPAMAAGMGKTALASSGAPSEETEHDAIDEIADLISEEYEEFLGPSLDEIERALEKCKNFDEIKQTLLELSATTKIEEIARKIGKANLNLRIAGRAGVSLDKAK
jgi:phage gp29-like protein